MKRKLTKSFNSTDISFDDFMSHPDSLGKTDKSVAELALEAQEAELIAKKKDRELKAAKQREKRAK
ncbi:hypothetical protein [Mucilaginibacter myungsuensis]|uniref:Uncharacterized protein n=1 Tax=Mucilaginibacter myungsuensis TaxID=649104 RepID=A0A929L0E6_9SPHI|nr:hypothetical protein [Mucilaginibacter myungsuensis]MBE9663940.1 hypothetical protein [Mucilaginibacter myungsuensis]MDN3598344.1 hypothetical protein [Mucilaginibacter myungsuensis]